MGNQVSHVAKRLINGPPREYQSSENFECSICLEDGRHRNSTRLPCGHIFHTKCMRRVVDNCLPACPMCFQQLKYIGCGCQIDSKSLVRGGALTHYDLFRSCCMDHVRPTPDADAIYELGVELLIFAGFHTLVLWPNFVQRFLGRVLTSVAKGILVYIPCGVGLGALGLYGVGMWTLRSMTRSAVRDKEKQEKERKEKAEKRKKKQSRMYLGITPQEIELWEMRRRGLVGLGGSL